MELFDFVKVFFDREKYKNVSENIKKKHYFMIMRFISIKYPIEANNFNLNGINQISTLDFWHDTLTKKFIGVPQFIYTKSKKKNTKSISKEKSVLLLNDLDKDAILFWCSKTRTSIRDLEFLINEIQDLDTYNKIKEIGNTLNPPKK